MSQHLSTSNYSLLVRNRSGHYRPATPQQILTAARSVINDQLPRGTSFTTPDLVREYLCAKLAGLEHEVFVALWLNTRHQLIQYEELFRGTIDATAIYPREVVRAALGCNAAAVIFAHNHPSGNATPSAEDRAITARLKQVLALIDVRVLDHIVIGGTTVASIAELGCL